LARRTLITFCVVFFLLSLCAPSKGALLKITDVRHWSAPDHTRIVVDSDKSISYQTLQLKDPWRLVVNIKKAKATFNDRKIDIGDSIVHRIRVGQFDREMLRLVIDLVKPTQSKVFTLDKYLDKPYRLVIDLHRTDLVEKGKKARLKQKSKKYKIIVVDPGHGGEDSGAVGARGTLEKNVVLSLA